MDTGLNTAQIIDRARGLGVGISEQQAQDILSQAWNPSIFGADPSRVDALLRSSAPAQESNPVLDFLKASADEASKRFDEYNRKLSDFDKANPYTPDEWLVEEKAKATQRLDPYYNQTLGDYLRGVETKKTRSLEDQRSLLTELRGDVDHYQGRAKISLDNALERSREGFADAGLYSSGAALRNQGQITEAKQAEEGDFLRRAGEREGTIGRTTQRTLDDLLYNEGIFRRDLGQERQYNIESSAQAGLGQRQGQHAFERNVVTGAGLANPQQFDQYTYSLLR